ncbi:hypothetical protein ABKA04_002019 [Annulohypoxylon sp. FPYF3050]
MFSFVFVVMASAIPMLEARPFAKTVANSTKANFGPLTFNHDDAWDQWGPQQDINSVKVINEILDAESPGLVVLNGDLITGENTFLENSTTYVDQIVTPLVNRGLTWASTYGNHDHQYNISGDTILAREKLWPNSRTQKMVNTENSGVSNYYLPVYDTGCSHDGCVPELLLWFFDSKGGFKYQKKNSTGSLIGNPDWVDNTVVDWFLKKNTELVRKYNKQIPSLAFVHIPTYASYVLQKQGIDAHLQPGINDDNPLATQGQGWCADGRNDGTCAYGGNDIPFMQAISSTPGLIAAFSGHDHGDSCMEKYATYPSLRGKTVLITGGAEGIGASSVELFCRQGSDVVFLDYSSSSAQKLLDRIKDIPDATTPSFLHCDVTDLVRLKECAEQVVAEHGGVDVLLNNAASAGALTRVPTAQVTPESWDADVNVNLRHQFFLTQAVVPSMQKRGAGSIINMGSITWRIPATGAPIYALCKAAVVGMTRTHSKEFGKDGVRVNSVVPGAIATQRQIDEVLSDEYRAEVFAAQSFKRDLMPEEVARLILFLAADDSSAITGSSYVIDGGWVSDI